MIALKRIAAVVLLITAACSTALRPSGADKAVPVPAPSPKSAEARADSEVIEGSGGELDLSSLPQSTIVRDHGELTAWGLAQVPPDARLQAAYAIADANARAELIAAMRVGIASSLSASGSASSGKAPLAPDAQEVNEQVVQVAGGFLPSVSAAAHGWKKVRPGPGRDVVLLAVSRISAREDALMAALVEGFKGRAPDPAAEAGDVLSKLGKGRPLGAQ